MTLGPTARTVGHGGDLRPHTRGATRFAAVFPCQMVVESKNLPRLKILNLFFVPSPRRKSEGKEEDVVRKWPVSFSATRNMTMYVRRTSTTPSFIQAYTNWTYDTDFSHHLHTAGRIEAGITQVVSAVAAAVSNLQ